MRGTGRLEAVSGRRGSFREGCAVLQEGVCAGSEVHAISDGGNPFSGAGVQEESVWRAMPGGSC